MWVAFVEAIWRSLKINLGKIFSDRIFLHYHDECQERDIEIKSYYRLVYLKLTYGEKSEQNYFSSDALYMLTSTPKQRFEFIFTDFGDNPKHFSNVFEIYKIYQATSLYRELKLRGAILTDGQLNILPEEKIFKQMSGIYNLSSDQVRL